MERTDAKTVVLKEKIYKELKVTFQGIEQKMKDLEDEKAELNIKIDMYRQCLAEHILSAGSDVVKIHLTQAQEAVVNIEKEYEKLRLERDAFRVEIEVYENTIR